MLFTGNFDGKLDKKNRVFVPARFRRILARDYAGGTAADENATDEPSTVLFARRDVFRNCLVLYPESVWENELSLLRSRLNKWNPQEQDVYRQFLLGAETVEMDSSGRILIPKRLIEQIGIESEVRFLGVDHTIEVWTKQDLDKPLVDEETFRKLIVEYMR